MIKTKTKRFTLPVLSLLAAALAINGSPALADMINVPGDYPTIQAAVTAASPGDTILCAAGNYAAGANLDKPLTLKGAQAGVDARGGRPGEPESVITVGGLGVFYLNSVGITIDGFTFSNLQGRTLDTYYDADNFTMLNCILEGNSGTYQGGSIQFGGGQNLHANNFLFEQNLVLVDNGYLLYMGHAMDKGTIRNNKFNGDSVSFGPFGTRTGWLIEGNEFDGDVVGHGPYWGFGFNANLGDVTIRNNNVHEMSVGIGQVSVVGGSITDNTFNDNSYAAFQLWGGEYGSVVSANVLIECNTINYNGTPCTGFADASHGIRLRVGLDASTIHMHDNNFTDLGVGTCGQAWAIRQNGSGTADAENNWWGTTKATVIATMFGQGDVDFDPWLTTVSSCAPTPPDRQCPIISNIQPTLVPVNTAFILTANANDTTTGNSTITSAAYKIEGGPAVPMTASDGSFDEANENVQASVAGFALPGVYTVCVSATDSAGNACEECVLLAVYDPNGGFVTGGGWINSPAGAYVPDPALTGKATFGFVSQYKKGASVPTGSTEFQFNVADLNFHSEVYQWLVVSGAKAQYKGTGQINNTGNYGFLLTATDGQVTGGGSVDKFRIKIWDNNNSGVIVYDNVGGSDDIDSANPQAIGGGSIVIHKK